MHSCAYRRLPRIVPLCAYLLTQCAGFGSAYAGGVYRWIDEQGRVHYDDVNRGGGVRVTRDLLQQRRIPEQPAWDGMIPAEVVAEVRRRCENAQARLHSYRDAPEIYTRDERGEVVALSSAETRQMLAEIRTEADYYCAEQAARRVHADRLAEAEQQRQQRSSQRRSP